MISPATKATIVFLLTAGAVPLLEALVRADVGAILADPKPWGVGLATAMIRAVASAALGKLVSDRVEVAQG